MTSERSTRTTLAIGTISAPVALYRTATDKWPQTQFDTAGPSGGVLRRQPFPKAAGPPPEPTVVDPLASENEEPPLLEPVEGNYGHLLVEEGTGEAVPYEAVRRGVRLASGGFVDLTEALARIDVQTKLEEMRVEGFIRREAVPRERVTGSYWVAAAEGSAYVLALLRQAMRAADRAAVVRWTKRTRQALGVVVPQRHGLILLEMTWAGLLREPREEVREVARYEVRDDHLEMAQQLVHTMEESPVLLDRLVDDAVEMRADLRRRALAGEEVELAVKSRPEEDLTNQLLASLS
jgi:non-homologous end joining protein Ku